MQIKSQRKNGAILSYITIIINTIIQFLYTPFLTRMLGQGEYGLYSLVSSVIGYLTVLDLGFGNAIIVFTVKYRTQGRYEDEKKLHGMFSVIYLIIGILSAGIGIILSFFAGQIFGNSMTGDELGKAQIMMLILTFNVCLTFIFSIYSSIITANEQFVFQKIVTIISAILRPLIMVPLLFLGFKSLAMCIVLTIVNILASISNYWFCKKRLKVQITFKGFDGALLGIIISYSFYIFLTVIVDKVNWNADHFILGIVCGTIQVSVYSIASQLTQLFLNLSTAISNVFLPKISQMVARNENSETLTSEMIKVGRLQFLIINLMATGLVIFGKPFIIWWVGNEYQDSYYVALILILPTCLPLIQNLGLSIMQAMNKYKFKALMTTAMAAGNIIISILLARKYQAIGAAIGTALAQIIGNVILINIYYKKVINLNVKAFWSEIIKMFLQFLPTAAMTLVIISVTNIDGIIGVLIYGSVYVAFYCLFAYRFAMNAYEKNIVKGVLGKFSHKI